MNKSDLDCRPDTRWSLGQGATKECFEADGGVEKLQIEATHWGEDDLILISERVKFGLAAAKARDKKLGRQRGRLPKSDKLAPFE